MQPRDFEDDLASSAERFAKKKKKLEMDRLKSTETTPCNSPLLGAVLVEDTQPRGSPLPVCILKSYKAALHIHVPKSSDDL